MASAVIRTYERKPSFSRNSSMKKVHNISNGFGLDPLAREQSYISEAMADSSDIRRMRRDMNSGPCVAQNFTTISADPPAETASEDSCSLKRKSMSLNGDISKESFISGLGNLVRALGKRERRQLRKRLKLDLQQVRSLCSKVEARELHVRSFLHSRPGLNGSTTNGYYVSPAAESSFRDGRISRQPSLVIPDVNVDSLNSLGKDKRTPKANQLYINSEFLSGKDKLPLAEKHKSKSLSATKRSLQGKIIDPRDSKRQKFDITHSKKISEMFKQCGVLLKKLMGHKFGWVFNEPVDVVKLNLHDYYKIIKKPMDLGTIKKKLDSGIYLLPSEFGEDVRLTFANAMKYNPQGHDVYFMADTLRGLFEGKWKTLDEKLRGLELARERLADLDTEEQQPAIYEQFMPMQTVLATKHSAVKKAKQASTVKPASKNKIKGASLPKRPMTFAEKQILSERLSNLPADKLEQAVAIMRKNPNLTQNDDEIEVDIESFEPEILWELHRFVLDSSRPSPPEKRPPQANPPEQMQSGVSKAAKTIVRGTEAGEEEVDIGDDMPAKEFPPVVIEKDRRATTKNSSSSSSSSGSGSSSSDSESGSSSGSDTEVDEGHSTGAVSKITSADKEPVGSAAVGDGRDSPTLEDDGLKRPVNDASSLTKVAGSDSHSQPEGNNEACQERQARAALLRSRFAETILKAQEKTLPLNKSDDPEKARKDQEELERRRKEEKARLHAEARAVELARKKAELAAAAEAKQRRDAEREAARLALQNMEKTVEIDESMEVLKDLERLRSGPPEHIPSSGDETSPVRSPEGGLPSFALKGANLLEQLGLFMRSDEEEEEQEVDPAAAPHSSS